MFGGSKQEQLEHRLDHKLNASSDGIDMDVPAKVISSETFIPGVSSMWTTCASL
jgi:ADP-ribose pyrophosphatase